MREVDTRYGRLQVPSCEADVIGNFLARYGEWAWMEVLFVSTVIRDEGRVLDVGAFVGTFGLGLASTQPLRSLYCVEANPAIIPLLTHNIAARAACPGTVIEALVVGSCAAPHFGSGEPGNLGSLSFRVGQPESDKAVVAVRSATLTELRAEYGPFDLIKLDVEGMEFEALNADADHLSTGSTTLWIECNEDVRSLDVAALVLSWKLPTYYFAFPSFHARNFNGHPDPIFPWAFEAGLLVAPHTIPFLTPHLVKEGCILISLTSVEDLREVLWRTPRWGMPQWVPAASAPELAALVGRSLRDETLETFLRASDAGNSAKGQTLWHRLAAVQADLEQAQLRLIQTDERTARLEAERQSHAEALALERSQRLMVQGELRLAEDRAATNLKQLGEERDLREQRAADCRAALREAQRGRERAERELALVSARALGQLSALGTARERAVRLELDREAERKATRAERAEEQDRNSAALKAIARSIIVRMELRVQADKAVAAARIQSLQARLELFDQRARVSEHAVEVMQASTTWRSTAPIRVLVDGVRLLRRRMRSSEPNAS